MQKSLGGKNSLPTSKGEPSQRTKVLCDIYVVHPSPQFQTVGQDSEIQQYVCCLAVAENII